MSKDQSKEKLMTMCWGKEPAKMVEVIISLFFAGLFEGICPPYATRIHTSGMLGTQGEVIFYLNNKNNIIKC